MSKILGILFCSLLLDLHDSLAGLFNETVSPPLLFNTMFSQLMMMMMIIVLTNADDTDNNTSDVKTCGNK